jgi:hypothetical protein
MPRGDYQNESEDEVDDGDDFGNAGSEIDEDPSDEDVERLDHESAYCPDCGSEVWDAVEVCPKCYAYLGGNTSHRPREVHARSPLGRRVALICIVILIIGLLWTALHCFGI